MEMDVGSSLVAMVLCLSLIGHIGTSDATELKLYPAYIRAELRGSVTIPLSWRRTSSATMTISQDISGARTDVLKINGTEYVVMNNWRTKASVEVSNGTDISWVNVTLVNVALEDDGLYTIKVRDEGQDKETLFNTGRIQIDTYALPIYTNIDVDNEQVNEGTEVKFTCTGNIGRPPGILALVQSFSSNFSYPVITISALDLPDSSKQMLPNGTYRLQHDFHVNLTRSDNGTTFKCRNIHHMPNHGIFESQDTAVILVNFTGVDFLVEPNRIVKGAAGTLTMKCSVPESNTQLYNIKIKREKASGFNEFEVVASFAASGDAELSGQIIDNNKGFVVSGDKNSAPPYIQLNMDISKMDCSDAKMYQCEYAYEDSDIVRGELNRTLDVYVLPSMTSLIGSRNGQEVDGSSSNKAEFNVGDLLQLTCKAAIGSRNTTKIRWERSSETSTGYIAASGIAYIISDGDALSDNQCGYTRIASLTYNVTAYDSSKVLSFRCFVSVDGYPSSSSTIGGSYTTPARLEYHLDVGSSTTKAPSAATAGSGNVGAIAGGVVGGLVLIVIVVLLVYFLWYRRRSSGEDYTTKEEYGSENPNMAPQLDTYASVDKSRRGGHENRGLDEPHESRRHYENQGRGKTNYARDRDADDYDDRDYDRDGSPTINHMGMDPMDGRMGTGV